MEGSPRPHVLMMVTDGSSHYLTLVHVLQALALSLEASNKGFVPMELSRSQVDEVS